MTLTKIKPITDSTSLNKFQEDLKNLVDLNEYRQEKELFEHNTAVFEAWIDHLRNRIFPANQPITYKQPYISIHLPEDVLALIEWLNNPKNDDESVWPEFSITIEENRLSNRNRFDGGLCP